MNHESLPAVCPGCGGAWNEAAENAAGSAACSRCGVDRQEALCLLWNEVAAAYAAAHEAAREGRFADARSLLGPLLQSAVYGDCIRRLDRLCASVLGESMAAANIEQAQTDYAAARRAAAMGSLTDALTAVDRCLSHAPYLLPAQKLRMLLLSGAGRAAEAESLRIAATALFAAEPDIVRWKFTGPPAIRRISRRRRTVPVILQSVAAGEQGNQKQNSERIYALPVALGAAALSVAALAMALQPRVLPASPASSLPLPVAAVTTVKVVPALPDKKRPLSADLTRERDERRRDADFAQARAWFNRAVRAKSSGNWRECDHYAAAAYELGKSSYLADESLVLRALAADNKGDSTSVRLERYVSIAENTPNSVYVPWALRSAVRLAEQIGEKDEAEKYRRLLHLRQRRTGAARKGASGSET